ncbi:actin-binding Rho-activating protein [Platysternon megacephalum]|uniref:Actin-binding Rho-activating protein n=1 Tax=Platysternon megacephalum TaxID=55544 RepID=A0A4D9F3H7_9SAUR|nr:actin-binding Rho-activating protein [Platysternon megacephalum]
MILTTLACHVTQQYNQFLQEACCTYSQITTAVCAVNCWSLCQECHKDRLCIHTDSGVWADTLFRKREWRAAWRELQFRILIYNHSMKSWSVQCTTKQGLTDVI